MKYGYKKYIVSINDKDVTDGVSAVEIFQDVQSPVWSCKIHFLDSVDLISSLPIKKGSKVKLQLGTYNNDYEGERDFDFTVYKIADKIHQNQKTMLYTVYCVADAFFMNFTKRVTKSIVGEPAAQISQIASEYLTGYNSEYEESSGNVSMVANNWSVFYTIGTLLKTAYINNTADYLFIQTRNKKFLVSSIESMHNTMSGIVFEYKPSSVNSTSDYPYTITKYEVEHFDGALNLSSGYYKSNVYTFDLTNKNWSKSTYTNNDDKQSLNDGDSDLFEGAENAHFSFVPKHEGIMSGTSHLDSASTWLPSRHAALQRLEQEKLIIQVPGSINLTDCLGTYCVVNLPDQKLGSIYQKDDIRAGKYLITAMSHVFTRGYYVMNIELVKRSFNE